MSYFQNDYKTAKILLKIYAFIGWFLVVIGILSMFIVPDAVGKSLPSDLGLIIGIVVGVFFAAFGLSMILISQVSRAVIDNSNANQERLRILKMEDYSSSNSNIINQNKKISNANASQKDRDREEAFKKVFAKDESKLKKTPKKIKAEDFKMREAKFEKDGIFFTSKNELDKYISKKQADLKNILIDAIASGGPSNIEDYKIDVPGYSYSLDGQMFKTKEEFKAYIDSQK